MRMRLTVVLTTVRHLARWGHVCAAGCLGAVVTAGSVAIPPASGAAAAGSKPRGAIVQLGGKPGCVYEPASKRLRGKCAEAVALSAPRSVAVSPDGRNVYVGSTGSDSVAAFSRSRSDGTLVPLQGRDACVAADSHGKRCSVGRLLINVSSVLVSRDGRNVYALASGRGVAVFRRDRASGALVQLSGPDGCVGDQASDAACRVGVAMDDAQAVALSPDGRNVYVASPTTDSVAVFTRNPATGALHQPSGEAACIAEPPADEETGQLLPCGQARGLSEPSAIGVSADGRNVYVGGSETLAVFARDPRTGALRQLDGDGGCFSSPLRADLIPCTAANGLGQATQVLAAPDGSQVFVSAYPIVTDAGLDNGVAVFRRSRANGDLTQPEGNQGCLSDLGDPCMTARGLNTDPKLPFNSNNLALSPDGRSLYLTTIASGKASGTISVFDRGGGRLTQLPGRDGCVGSAADGCAPARAIQGVSAAVVSPDGRNVYATSYWDSAVAVFSRTTS